MKKIFTIMLAAIMLLSFVACSGNGGKPVQLSPTEMAFKAASEAYGFIDNAYQLTEQFGSDVYEAWRIGIYDSDEASISYLAKKLNLTESEISAAIESLLGEGIDDFYFTYYEKNGSLFSACVWLVSEAYNLNGKTKEIEDGLATAKELMKDMSAKYSDYEHYPNLKGYYTTTSAFFEFCKDPTGSFEQVKNTINDYRNNARNYRNELAYIFDD